MEILFKKTSTRATLFVAFFSLIFLLIIAPYLYNLTLPMFAILDQHILFKVFSGIGILGLIFYLCFVLEKNNFMPTIFSAFIFGLSSFGIVELFFDFNNNGSLFLIVGTLALSFTLFRRGIFIDTNLKSLNFWKQIFAGFFISLLLFVFLNFLIKNILPEITSILRYGMIVVLMFVGAHIKQKGENNLDIARFSYDMTLLVILYNFLLFGSRLSLEAIFSISKFDAIYGVAFVSTIYGLILGLLGAYVIYRQKSFLLNEDNNDKVNLYILPVIMGVLAFSFLFGANPFVASAVMGLFISLKDSNFDPQNHLFYKTESIINTVVFFIIGATFSVWMFYNYLLSSMFVGSFLFFLSIIGFSGLLFLFGKMKMLPKLSIKLCTKESFSRIDAIAILGSVSLFSAAYLRDQYFFLFNIVIIVSFFIWYLIPIILNLLKIEE